MVVGLLLLIGMNYYVAVRLLLWLHSVFPCVQSGLFYGGYVLLALSMVLGFARSALPLGQSVRKLLGAVSSCWMGFFIYLFVFFLVADTGLLLLKILLRLSGDRMLRLRTMLGTAVVVLTLGLGIYGMIHAGQIKLTEYEILPRSKTLRDDMRILLISDVHIGALGSEKRLEKIVERINEQSADVVCIAGDFFDSDYLAIDHPERVEKLMRSIQTRYGVYACLGNHDAGDSFAEMEAFYKRCGVRLLVEEAVPIAEDLTLLGRMDPAPIGSAGSYVRQSTDTLLHQTDAQRLLLVLEHNPATITEYGAEAELILSGHTHRGQIFPGSLFTARLFPEDYGYYRAGEEGPQAIVSSGAGIWGMPMRVGTDCEVVSILLRATEEQDTA